MSARPSIATVRERVRASLHAARDHDAYWSRPTRGWRDLRNFATAAGRGGYVPDDRVRLVLGAAVADGYAEERRAGDGAPHQWRLVESVVPTGGDARLCQP